MEPAELLKKYFGYDTFRPMQEDVIKTILSGRDVLAVMPTGAGKSVCFQIPALLFPHGTIIISPLISLMKDQVEALAEQGVSASYVNSTVPFDESIERLRDLFRGRIYDIDLHTIMHDRRILRQDCNSPFPFQRVGIHDAFRHLLIFPENMALLQHGIHKSGFTMIDMGDDCDITNVVSCCYHKFNLLFNIV